MLLLVGVGVHRGPVRARFVARWGPQPVFLSRCHSVFFAFVSVFLSSGEAATPPSLMCRLDLSLGTYMVQLVLLGGMWAVKSGFSCNAGVRSLPLCGLFLCSCVGLQSRNLHIISVGWGGER